jgi:ADP-ribose pyrophosphatase
MITKREIVFRTRWFQVEAKHDDGSTEPYYSLKLPDYVTVVAYTTHGNIVLVNQFRHAVEAGVLELPSGLVDGADGPEAHARRELEEETGFRAAEMVHLGTIYSDVGRLQNRIWCYLARDVRTIDGWEPEEAGIQSITMSPSDLGKAIREGRFKHALHLAVLELARHHQF